RQRERNGIAEQQEHDQRREHQRRHVGDEKLRHFAASSRAMASSSGTSCFSNGSGMRPLRNAMRLISSETPCSESRQNPTGTRNRAGHRIRPPALPEISLLFQAFMNIGQESQV